MSASVQTGLYPPPLRDSQLPPVMQQWLFTLQNLMPLVVVDTSTGNQVIALPPAGVNSSTGQSAQNREMTFIKSTVDANTVTISGGQGGSAMLIAQYDFVRFKSDGTNWWRIS